jgi:hypothetical protein
MGHKVLHLLLKGPPPPTGQGDPPSPYDGDKGQNGTYTTSATTNPTHTVTQTPTANQPNLATGGAVDQPVWEPDIEDPMGVCPNAAKTKVAA